MNIFGRSIKIRQEIRSMHKMFTQHLFIYILLIYIFFLIILSLAKIIFSKVMKVFLRVGSRYAFSLTLHEAIYKFGRTV